MDIEKIRALAQIVTETGLTSLQVSEGDLTVRLEKGRPAADAAGAPAAGITERTATEQAIEEDAVDFSRLIEVKSPLVGVFYSSPSPDAVPFVTIGSKVKKGDVLCIVEAMKLMNEITAETDGEIVDVCLKNGDIAEYGQVLFKMY